MQNTQRRLRMQALGAELARIRKAAGMSKQEDLEERSGVGVRTISDIETGKKIARINTMRKLEAALGLEPGVTDDFMAGTVSTLVGGQPQPGPETGDAGSDDVTLARVAAALFRQGLSAERVDKALSELTNQGRALPRVSQRNESDQLRSARSLLQERETGTQ